MNTTLVCLSRPFAWLIRVLLQARDKLMELPEGLAVVIANLWRDSRPLYHRFRTWDLLKAARMARFLADGDRVLDVGCGTGHTLEELGLFRDLDRWGIEISPVWGDDPAAGVHFLPYDGHTLPFPAKHFDVTLFCYVLHHTSPEHARSLLRQAVRTTRRTILLLEDSLPTFGLLYRWRNSFHRWRTEIQYARRSQNYEGPRGDSMFLTHAGWHAFLSALPGVLSVNVQPLGHISVHRHHTMIAVTLQSQTEDALT